MSLGLIYSVLGDYMLTDKALVRNVVLPWTHSMMPQSLQVETTMVQLDLYKVGLKMTCSRLMLPSEHGCYHRLL